MPTGNFGMLNGIEVVSANNVWAMGRVDDNAAALHWDGGVWSIAYTYPTPANDLSEFYGIRALAANDIWAVGYTYHDGFTSTLTMHWDGTQWNVVPSPSFGPSGSKLYAAAPVSANDVWAVGTNVFDNISGTILVERYESPCSMPTQTTTPAPTITIDPSFGDGGKVVTDFDSGSDIGYDTVVQPDGKIIVVGAATQSFDGRMGWLATTRTAVWICRSAATARWRMM